MAKAMMEDDVEDKEKSDASDFKMDKVRRELKLTRSFLMGVMVDLIQTAIVTIAAVGIYHLFVASPAIQHAKGSFRIVAVDTIGHGMNVVDELGKGTINKEQAQQRLADLRRKIAAKYPGYVVLEAGAVVDGVSIDEDITGEKK